MLIGFFIGVVATLAVIFSFSAYLNLPHRGDTQITEVLFRQMANQRYDFKKRGPL